MVSLITVQCSSGMVFNCRFITFFFFGGGGGGGGSEGGEKSKEFRCGLGSITDSTLLTFFSHTPSKREAMASVYTTQLVQMLLCGHYKAAVGEVAQLHG